MTLVKYYVVGCQCCYVMAPGGAHIDGAEARRAAKRAGWLRIPRPHGPRGQGVDLCPGCRHREAEFKATR